MKLVLVLPLKAELSDTPCTATAASKTTRNLPSLYWFSTGILDKHYILVFISSNSVGVSLKSSNSIIIQVERRGMHSR